MTAIVNLSDVRKEAIILLGDAPLGAPLDALTDALIGFAVCASVTTLDPESMTAQAERAVSEGASQAQLHEVLYLVSGLGVHSLFEGARLVNGMFESDVDSSDVASAPLDIERQKLWDTWVGVDRYWTGFEREIPRFLRTLLDASPEGFEAFFRYCAVPWSSGLVPPLAKELIAMATDATPTHRFLPGMRLHLRNAMSLGAGRAMVLSSLDIAAKAPGHPGIR